MKIPFFLRLTILLLIALAVRASGDDTTEMLNNARDLVRQVENPSGSTPAHRIDLLAQAITAAQQAPNHRLQGHRVLAIQAIRGAIAEIRSGDANHQVAVYLHTAELELSSSITLAGGNDTREGTATNSAPANNGQAPNAYTSQSPAETEEIVELTENGPLDKVKSLFQNRPDLIFSKDKDGLTPLHQAIDGDQCDVAAWLLDHKADVDAKDNSGQTPLLYAAQSDDTDVADLLVARGANLGARDADGTTPLLEAASEGNKNMVKFLLSKGADIEAKDNSGCTPLIWASIQGHKDIVEILLGHHATVNAGSPCGQTALNSAAMKGHEDVAEILLDRRADLSAKAKDGQTALDWAVDNGQLDMVKFLLAKGADVNAKANDGSTPLRLAELNHNYDVASLLREHGGREPDGSIPGGSFPTSNASSDPASLEAAVEAGDLAKVKALVQANPQLALTSSDGEWAPLVSAASRNHPDIVKFLLANHADINSRNEMGATALFQAAGGGNLELATFLIAQGADVNMKGSFGQTPLYTAIQNWRRKDMTVLLLAHGGDPNIGDQDGRTPLHLAAGWIHPDQAELLLANHANPNAKDKAGDTPLYLAASDGARDDIAQVLLMHGADPQMKGHDGRTPREVALRDGDKDLVAIMSNPEATLGPPAAPLDCVSASGLIERFMADMTRQPPGSVENDVADAVVETVTGLAKMTGTKISPRDAIVKGFHIFTLDGPVSEFWAQGGAAIYEGNATLTEAAAKDFQDDYDQSSTQVTFNGQTTTDKGPFLSFGPAATDFADAKVPADRRVVVSFCLVMQQGDWKVLCLYFGNGPLAGDNKKFVVEQLGKYSRDQGK